MNIKVLLPACVVIGIVAVGVLLSFREPRYDGRSLSEWIETDVLVERKGKNKPTAEERTAFTNALSHMGTKAVPYLVAWMQYQEYGWEKFLNALHIKLGGSVNHPNVHEIRALNAAAAFQVLGPRAEAAVPELSRLLSKTDTEVSYRAALALGFIGGKGFSPLFVALTNKETLHREHMAEALGMMGKDATPAIPTLTQYLKSPDEHLARMSAWALGNTNLNPELAIPALVSSLKDNRSQVRGRAVLSLAEFGPNARAAVPGLRELLEDPVPGIRKLVLDALQKIDPSEVDKPQ